MSRIESATARAIYDSRGRPTIEVEVRSGRAIGRGIAPAGASTGAHEARELRDPDGRGVRTALARFAAEVAPALIGADCREQAHVDRVLIALDGTPDRGRLGGNTLIASSFAVLRLAAEVDGAPLWRYLAGTDDLAMPLPEIQIVGGGAHAHGRVDLQDFMVLPVGAQDWATALDWCARVYTSAGAIFRTAAQLHGVADEGGFWPDVANNEAALELLVRAIEGAGLRPADDVAISLDVAANQFFRGDRYRLRADSADLHPDQWVERLAGWRDKFAIRLIEDPCAETDRAHYAAFRARVRGRCGIVGDDLVVTDATRIRDAARDGLIDAALIKPNQAGTVSEARAALEACVAANVMPIVSARSGETEDATIVHLAVGWRAPMLKVGSITRGERTAKWNEGIRIAEQLRGGGAIRPFAPASRGA
ncbi:MAG TPA: enolase C-terminal domain-like protein [Pseudomonadales bacterium]|nr:enolase C-terminal domain-like protein [Pseudomonadales bacterium]